MQNRHKRPSAMQILKFLKRQGHLSNLEYKQMKAELWYPSHDRMLPPNLQNAHQLFSLMWFQPPTTSLH